MLAIRHMIIIADIKGKFSAFVWDDPRQVLLTLAAAVESAMGGTSGAVNPNPSCPSTLMIAIYTYVHADLQLVSECWSCCPG